MNYDCFNSVLGIKGCDEVAPINELYINGSTGLAGINILSASAIADEETNTGLELLKGCRFNAILEVLSDAKTELSKYFKFNKIIHNYHFNPVTHFRNGAFLYEAVVSSAYQYSKIQCDVIYIKSKSIQSSTLTITEDGVARTMALTLAVGLNAINVNSTASNTLSFGATFANDVYYDGTAFFSGDVRILCDDIAFFCSYKRELAQAIRFKAGYNYMLEMVNSNRLNSVIEKDMAVGTMALWYGSYNSNNGKFEGGEYQKHLSSAIETIKNSLNDINDCCIECSQIKHVYAKP